MTVILPARYYIRDPLSILIDKESAMERRLAGCKGCRYLMVDAIGTKIITVCTRGKKVGRKGKCSTYKESQ